MQDHPRKLTWVALVSTYVASGLLWQSQGFACTSEGERHDSRTNSVGTYEPFANATNAVVKGDWERAIREFTVCIRDNATNALLFEWRGGAFFANGQFDEAIVDYGIAIRLKPANPTAYLNRAHAYRANGELEKATADLTSALRLDLINHAAFRTRAVLHKEARRISETIADCNQALLLDPADPTTLLLRGYAYRMQGRFDNAAEDYSAAVRLAPDNPDAENDLAWLYSTCPAEAIRNGTAAVSSATKACEISAWKKWEYLDTLAAAYAEQGDFQKAIHYQEMALSMATSPNARGEIVEMKGRLALYRQQKPYRENLNPKENAP